MGNDGGSIPSRDEMVRTKAAPRAKDDLKQAAKQDAWSYCALSRSQLTAPLVSDGHGKLYNKESILTYLLEPSEFAGDASKQMAHVTSMKDVVVLQLSKSGDKYICEVTRRDMDGATPFVYLTPCGHALAKAALSHSDDRVCPVCDMAFDERDIIPINPEEADTARLQSRLEALAAEGLTHSGAPMRKKKRK
ncbi:Rtf2 RING-finger-domain-containing protein, partial [Protomyces lactucae-debilis]